MGTLGLRAVIWFLELTVFQGIHTFLGLRPGMHLRSSGCLHAIEFSVVSP